MKGNKRFCSNCRYFWDQSVSAMGMGYIYNGCRCPDVKETEDINIRARAHYHNSQFNCVSYHRKWWKFWIKNDALRNPGDDQCIRKAADNSCVLTGLKCSSGDKDCTGWLEER